MLSPRDRVIRLGNHNPFCRNIILEAIRLIAHNLPLAYSKGTNVTARFNMLLAANIAGLAFASSRLGAVHGLAYIIDTESTCPMAGLMPLCFLTS